MILERKIFTISSILFAFVTKNYAIPSSTTPQSNPIIESDASNSSFLAITEEKPIFSTQDYMNSICNQEPTCHLVDQVPKEFQTLTYRNCMCDKECVTYGDCCLDSKFYNETEQSHNYKTFTCSREKVYMISTCPSSYADPTVISKCAKAFDDLRESNTKLIVPVTNLDTNITYANEYCALCNGDLIYNHWNLTAICSQEFTPLSVPTTYDIESGDSNSTNITRDYYWETTEATKYIEFDSITKTFKSKFNNRRYECTYHTVAPNEFTQHMRACISNVVSECAANFTDTSELESAKKCKSYTSVGVNRYQQNILYRNRECASCNGEKSEDFQAICGPLQATRVGLSTIFTTGNKGSGTGCSNPSVASKFCR